MPFHRSLRWLLAAVLATFWSFRQGNSPDLANTPQLPPTPLLLSTAAAATNSPASAETAWNRWRAQIPATKPAIEDVTEWPVNRAEPFEKFRAWQSLHRAPADMSNVEAQGVALAKARRAAMARWIERDPEFALAQAVGPDARRELPAAVLARGLDPQAIHLETGGEVALAAHARDAFAVEAKLLQREAGRGPSPVGGLKAGATLPAGLPPGMAAFPPSPGWTLGLKRILIIRVDFSDDPGGPFDRNTGTTITTNLMARVMGQTDLFYRENSQNQTSLLPTFLPAVLRMPQDRAAYGAADPMGVLRMEALAAART